MTDESERQCKRFHGEKEELLRRQLSLDGGDVAVPLWKGSDLDPTKDHVSPVKHKEEPEGEKIQGDEEEEASHVAPGKDKDPPPPPPPEPERKKIQGEEEARPDAAFSVVPRYWYQDPEAPHYLDDMAEFYLEAARRLPIAQMPRLAGFLSRGGLLLGFNDPVTNIIVNAIYLMGKASDFGVVLPLGADPARHAADRASYVDIAHRSRSALVAFMIAYFRHLTEAQAERYLTAARHDLVLAIGLVEWHRTGDFDLPPPDCSRTKTALWYAAVDAELREPRDLVRLLASRFPRHLLDPVLDDLRRGEQLSVGRVNDILNLLRHPWSPPPPALPLLPHSSISSQDADGNVTMICNLGHDHFSTTTVTGDQVAAFNNNNKNSSFVTKTTISRHPRRRDDDDFAAAAAYLSTGSDTESRLRSFLSTNNALQLQPDTNSLKMSLLDTIHGLYIEALAMLPSDHQPRLLRATLAGGHCYGVMEDPVFNIVVNSIWYSAHFPHHESADGDDDILIVATRSMTLAESASLRGLITILHADHGVTEQEAVACLCKNSKPMMTSSLNRLSLAAAAEAARHPQPAALVAFLTTLLTPEKRDRLRSLLMAKRALSNVDFKELHMLIAGNDVAAAPVQKIATTPALGQSALNTMSAPTLGGFGTPITPKLFQQAAVSPTAQSVTFPAMSIFGFNTIPATPVPDPQLHSFVRTNVEELIRRDFLLGPQTQFVICGVESRICSADTTCYHVNFLASMSADFLNSANTSTLECKLYFAEFWNKADDKFEGSKKRPICFPIHNYHAFPGRCFICEGGPVKIVHPPCGNYFKGREISTDAICAAEERHADLGQ